MLIQLNSMYDGEDLVYQLYCCCWQARDPSVVIVLLNCGGLFLRSSLLGV